MIATAMPAAVVTSASAMPAETTFARCAFLYLFEESTASCSLSCLRHLVTIGRNSSDSLRDFRYEVNFSIATATDQIDMTARMKTTPLATGPICPNMVTRLNSIVASPLEQPECLPATSD